MKEIRFMNWVKNYLNQLVEFLKATSLGSHWFLWEYVTFTNNCHFILCPLTFTGKSSVFLFVYCFLSALVRCYCSRVWSIHLRSDISNLKLKKKKLSSEADIDSKCTQMFPYWHNCDFAAGEALIWRRLSSGVWKNAEKKMHCLWGLQRLHTYIWFAYMSVWFAGRPYLCVLAPNLPMTDFRNSSFGRIDLKMSELIMH